MKTCLLVDESPVVRKVARRLLEDLDFAVAEAADGMEALAWCRAMMPDLVLLDAGMPSMSGLEFLRRLRLEPGGRAPKVVFCSAETDLDRIRAAGVPLEVNLVMDADTLLGSTNEPAHLDGPGAAIDLITPTGHHYRSSPSRPPGRQAVPSPPERRLHIEIGRHDRAA